MPGTTETGDQQGPGRERDFLNAVLDTVGALVVVLDRHGRIVRFNQACEHSTGYLAAEVQGRPFWDFLLVPEEIGEVKGVFAQLQAGQFPNEHENLWLAKDGSRRLIAWSNTALPGEDGAVEYVIATGIDITKRREAEAERERLLAEVVTERGIAEELARTLERERDTLRSIMDNTRSHIAHFDTEFCFLDVNSTYERGSGYGRDELLGRFHFDLFPDPENETIFERVRDSGQAVEFRAKPFEFIDQPERGVTYWDWSLAPVKDSAGQVQGLVLSLEDVTEQRRAELALRESEAKLRTLFELLPVGISILDQDRRIVQENPALARILHLSRASLQAGNHRRRTYLRADGTPMPADEFPSTRSVRDKGPAQGEVGVVTEDGAVIWTQVRAVPVPFQDWNLVIVTTDITERKEAEEALLRANEELEQRVAERTAELLDMNRLLEAEIAERRQVERELRRSEELLDKRVKERTHELATLLEISNAVALSHELGPLVCRILDLLGAVVCHEGATVYRLEGNVLEALLHRDPLPTEGVDLPVQASSLATQLLERQQPVLIPDVRAATPLAGALRQVAGDRFESLFGHLQTWLGIPMAVQGRLIGLLALGRGRPPVFDEREVELAHAFAGQLAVALENERLYRQAQELAVMEERQKLARELHDAVSQTLFSASLAAEVLPRIWEKDCDAGLECLAEVRHLTRGALAEMRTLLVELRPAALIQTELAVLIHQLADATGNRARIPVAVDAEEHCPLPPDVQISLYRIAQEALNNIARHANAQQASLTLRCTLPEPTVGPEGCAGRVELTVADDGCGFMVAAPPSGYKGLGLGIMRERARVVGAELEITSEAGKGTRITVTWPADN